MREIGIYYASSENKPVRFIRQGIPSFWLYKLSTVSNPQSASLQSNSYSPRTRCSFIWNKTKNLSIGTLCSETQKTNLWRHNFLKCVSADELRSTRFIMRFYSWDNSSVCVLSITDATLKTMHILTMIKRCTWIMSSIYL